MEYERYVISFLPVILFYLVYFRYFTTGGSKRKYLTSMLSGMWYALFLILLGNHIDKAISGENPFVLGFIFAAFLEKGGSIFCIYLVFRKYSSFTITRGIITGMFFGLGFACVENIFYGGGSSNSVIYIRIIFSVPLHITTCGLAGFYLGIAKLSGVRVSKIFYYFKGGFIPLMLHGVFDYFLLKGGYFAYASAPVLIFSVVFLEIILSRSTTIFSGNELRIMGMNFEDWRVKDRQPRYDRWVKRYTGILKSMPVPLLNWNPGLIRFFFVFVMICIAASGLPLYRYLAEYKGLSLMHDEVVAVFILLPICIALALMVSGIINPEYFVRSLISLPVISDVDIMKDGQVEEYFATNDITAGNCFLQTTKPLGMGKEVNLRFRLSYLVSPPVRGFVVWENHTIRHEPHGSIISFRQSYREFYLFLIRYRLLRLWKGAVFLLRLPGFDALKGLFYKPLIITQENLYLRPGDVIFRENDLGDRCYMLKKGRVIFFKEKEDGNIITVNTAVTGEVFGELSVLGHQNIRNATAMCATDCIIAVATKENLDVLLKYNHDFTLNLIETLTSRLILTEKIYLKNIKELERHQIENERLAHMAVVLILSAIGFGSDKKTDGFPMDINSMLRYIRKMDEIDVEILTNLMMKKQMSGVNDEDLEKEVRETLVTMFSRLEDVEEE